MHNAQQLIDDLDSLKCKVRYQTKLIPKNKLKVHSNQYDSSYCEFYQYRVDNIDDAFDIHFDQELFIAPKKIRRLQQHLKVVEKWKEEDLGDLE